MDNMNLQANPNIDVKVTGTMCSCQKLPKIYSTVVLTPYIKEGENRLVQSNINKPNTKYVVKYNFTLANQIITIPEGCILDFDGGSFSNGTLVGNDTIIVSDLDEEQVLININLEGTFIHKNREEILKADEEDVTNANGLIKFKDKEAGNGMGKVILRNNFVEQYPSNIWMFTKIKDIVYLLYSYQGKVYAIYNADEYRGLVLKNNVVKETLSYHPENLPEIVAENYLTYTTEDNVHTITLPDESTITSTVLDATEMFMLDETEKVKVNLLTQSMIDKENTIYVIKYDFELAENITIPENCVLKFDGGSLNGNTFKLNTLGKLVIDGYGCNCFLENADNTVFIKPYCVSTIHGQKTGADGSPNKPFYYLQDALDVCNNIVIERNSIFSINQAYYVHNKYNIDNIGVLKHNTKILTYGEGNNPLLSGKVTITNAIVNVGTTTRIVDFSKAYIGSTITNSGVLYYTDAPWMFNFGYITDDSELNKLFPIHIGSTSTLVALTFKNPTAGDYSKIEELSTNPNFTSRWASACYRGISANHFSITIEDVNFDSLWFGITGFCDNSQIKNCNFTYIGGCSVGEGNNSIGFSGNAIESYLVSSTLTAKNIIVCNCTFNNIFDAAITLQGGCPNFSGRFYNNIVSGAKWAFEFFNTNAQSKNNIVIENNIIKNCDILGGAWRYHTFDRDLPGSAAPGGAFKVDTKTNSLQINSNMIMNCNFYVSEGGTIGSYLRNNIITIKSGSLFKINFSNLQDNPLYINEENIQEVLALLNYKKYGAYSTNYNNIINLINN